MVRALNEDTFFLVRRLGRVPLGGGLGGDPDGSIEKPQCPPGGAARGGWGHETYLTKY